MNIKKIYLVFGVSSVLLLVSRFVQLLCGIDAETGLSSENFASILFPILLILSVLSLLFITKFSYGVAKITEFEIPRGFFPALLLLGAAFIIDSVPLIISANESLFLGLSVAETALSLLSGIGMLLLGFAVRKDSKRSVSLLIFCPVMLYCVKLISLFMTSVSIANSLSVSLTLFKIIFMLLFYLSTLQFLFDPDMEKSTSGVIFYALSASLITLSDIIPNYFLILFGKGKYETITEKISFPDIFFCAYAIIFAVAVINSVIKKSKLLQSKVTEE